LVWDYLYVPQEVFAKVDDNRLEMLFSLCEPSKQSLIQEKIDAPLSLEKGNLEKVTLDEFISEEEMNSLPPKCKKGIQEAIVLFKFLEKKSDISYAAVFTPLLGSVDEAAKSFIISTLKDSIPEDLKKRERFFEPDLTVLHPREQSFHKRQGSNLRRTLLDNDGVMPMGLLKWCLEYARSPKTPPGGIFSVVKIRFEVAAKTDLRDTVDKIYSFRNEYIAHQEKELVDKNIARQAMADWISGLRMIWQAE
jgi:type III restriction enzyme